MDIGIAGIGLPWQAQPSREEKAQARLQVSKELTEVVNDAIKKDYFITADKAAAEGYTFSHEPEPMHICPFCGRALYQRGVKDFLRPGAKRIIAWAGYEACGCPGAVADREQRAAQEAVKKEEARVRAENEKMQKKISRLLKNSGMGARFASRTFERFEITAENRNAYRACLRYAENFPKMLPVKDERGNQLPPAVEMNGLFLTGSYGTGKTHLAAAIANRLIQGGTAVICMTMTDLLARIRESYNPDDSSSEAQIMRLYKDTPLLVIDDIGSEYPTEWGSTTIFSIINARYEAYMPTIVTTNYSGPELVRRMTPLYNGRPGDSRNAEKTLDRLHEMCAGIEMNWKSYRG